MTNMEDPSARNISKGVAMPGAEASAAGGGAFAAAAPTAAAGKAAALGDDAPAVEGNPHAHRQQQRRRFDTDDSRRREEKHTKPLVTNDDEGDEDTLSAKVIYRLLGRMETNIAWLIKVQEKLEKGQEKLEKGQEKLWEALADQGKQIRDIHITIKVFMGVVALAAGLIAISQWWGGG